MVHFLNNQVPRGFQQQREFVWVVLQPVSKQMILFLIKKYPGLFGEGYSGAKVLKK